MSPGISAVIRLNPIRLGQCIDEALQREVAHVLSGKSDYESGSTEAVSGFPQHPIPSMPNDDSPTQLSSGKKAADKLRRQRKRIERRAHYPSLPRSSNSKKYRDIDSISVDFNADGLPAAKGAFVSQRQVCDTSHERTLGELVASGFKVVEWDGRTPTAIVDQEDRIMTILAGRPQGQDWDQVHLQMGVILEQAGSNVQGSHKERRGSFVSLSTGVSYGGGQTAGLPFACALSY
ncbi:hypothetical protein J3R83DRAFT_4373 [Lanmaoa asiatica]|nr:hypothetical protein J3R83DRAFT_4373 [Lanmaoa asiatica]